MIEAFSIEKNATSSNSLKTTSDLDIPFILVKSLIDFLRLEIKVGRMKK
jgi:hypothetical protein